MAGDKSYGSIIKNALFYKNPIFVSGMVIAPAVVMASNLFNAMALITAFSVITFFTLLISSFIPRSIVYTIRIILYTLVGALVYIPSVILLKRIMPIGVEALGIFFPLFIANGFVISRSDSIFFSETKKKMLLDIIFCIIGYDVAVFLFAFVREILSTGTLCGKIIGMPTVLSVFEKPFGGFILLGIMAALFRSVLLFIKKLRQK